MDSKLYGTVSIGYLAKAAGLGQNRLFKFLREKKILMHNNLPYQRFLEEGYFKLIPQHWSTPDGIVHTYFKSVCTQKGADYVNRLVDKELGLF